VAREVQASLPTKKIYTGSWLRGRVVKGDNHVTRTKQGGATFLLRAAKTLSH